MLNEISYKNMIEAASIPDINGFVKDVCPEDYERVDFEIKDQISKSDKKYDKVKYRIITKNGNIKNVTDYGHLVTKDYNDDIFYVFIA